MNANGAQAEQALAMAYGDAFLIDGIGAFDLADFAVRTSMSPNIMARELITLAKKALALAPELTHQSCYDEQERVLVQQIAQFVMAQSDRLLRIAPLIPEVDTDLR